MADLVPIEFSQLTSGGNIQAGDIVVGLRGGLNRKFTFSSVLSVTGTANEITVTGSTAPIISIANNPVLPGNGGVTVPAGTTAQRAGNAGTLRFNSQTTELETTLDGSTWVTLTGSGGTVLSVSGTANRITSTGGVNPVIDIAATYVGQTSITTLGTISTGLWNGTLIGTTYGGTGLSSFTSGQLFYASSSSVMSQIAYQSTGGTYGDTSNIMARDANGNTASNNIINGQTTTASGGTITLTAASARTQVISGASSTTVVLPDATTLLKGHTFYLNNNSSGGITVQTNGGGGLFTGTAGNYVQVICTNNSTSTGSWDYHWLLPSTAPSGCVYLSNGITSGYRFSSATYPFTTTANQLLYSSASNTISGLSSANSAVLVTNSSGVPSFSSSLTDGQLIIGSTGSTPVAASLTAGSGVTITPGAGSITISATGSGGTVTSVTASSPLASSGGATPNISLTGTVGISNGGTNITTYALGDILYCSAANVLSKLAGNTTTTKQYLSQTGDGVNSAAPAWATIAGTDITGAALTKTDDTNVTLTLGGTPTTALLRAASLTLGWTGQLSVSRGGTGNSTFTAYSVICAGTTATGVFQNVSGVGTSGQVLTSNGASALPTWQSAASGGNWIKISASTASSSASIAFTGLSSSYAAYAVVIGNAAPATNDVSLLIRTSTNNGSSYDSGASDYQYIFTGAQSNGTSQNASSTGATSIDLTGSGAGIGIGNAAGSTYSGIVYIYNASAALPCKISFSSNFYNTVPRFVEVTGGGVRATSADVDAIQFLMSSGNIASGTFTLYGLSA